LGSSPPQPRLPETVRRLLEYPADARLILINADDVAICRAINEAFFRTIIEGLVRPKAIISSSFLDNPMQV
jgi:hypothetical protein